MKWACSHWVPSEARLFKDIAEDKLVGFWVLTSAHKGSLKPLMKQVVSCISVGNPAFPSNFSNQLWGSLTIVDYLSLQSSPNLSSYGSVPNMSINQFWTPPNLSVAFEISFSIPRPEHLPLNGMNLCVPSQFLSSLETWNTALLDIAVW